MRLYSSPAGVVETDCLLTVELERFAPSRWGGLLTNVRPVPLPAGRYRMRLPNGRERAIDLAEDTLTGSAFVGLGSLPLP